MKKLSRDDLYSLEEYAQIRHEFRSKVMQHKQNRRVELGAHASLYFEDRLTMQYQIQEMLRIERIFEADAIEEELAAYNPLIPDESNLKATFMLEYGDVEERHAALAELNGIESKVWLRVNDLDKVYPISNEDLERSNDEKTSAVHFMRFELADEMITALKEGAAISMGIEHPFYQYQKENLADAVQFSLLTDLQIN